MTLDSICEELFDGSEPEVLIPNVFRPLGQVNDGKTIHCSSLAELGESAHVFEYEIGPNRVGKTWLSPSSVCFSSDCDLKELGRDITAILIAGDLSFDGFLTLDCCSLIVAGQIHCQALYRNSESDCTYARTILADDFIFAEYPGEYFVVTESVVAPLVLLSDVAWNCPKVDAEVFFGESNPGKDPQQLESALALLSIAKGDFDSYAKNTCGDEFRALREILRKGGSVPMVD